jgi:hypothetical protein
MPYALTLQAYAEPGWFREPPEAWQRRLREVSGVTERMEHLRFRFIDPRPHWFDPGVGLWMLYACKPKTLVPVREHAKYDKHWSELPESEQEGRKSSVSSYQHFMWTTQGVEVRPFWILQGPNGGTPAKYSRREVRLLDAEGMLSEPFPPGTFPPCPFDERAVAAILERDRFVQAERRFEELEKMDRPAALKAQDDLAEQEFRRAYVKNLMERLQPQAEFMKSYLRKSESNRTLPDAPDGLANQVAAWKEQYIEHGSMPGATNATTRGTSILVT